MENFERAREREDLRDGVLVLVPSLSSSLPDSSSLDFADLLDLLWRDRWPIAMILAAFALASIAYVALASQWFKAQTLIASSEQSSAGGLREELGGLAVLAGFGIAENNSANAVATLKSRDLAREFIEKNELLPILFANDWDANAGRWRSANPDDWPDISDGVTLFDERIRTVTEDRATGLVRLAIEWTDPALAAEWTNQLVQATNERMRRRAISESEANLKYLSERMSATTVVSLQQAIGRLQERELQTLMLAQGSAEFAFKTIDPAEIPGERSAPRVIVVAAAGIVGAMLAIACLIVVQVASRRRQDALSARAH